MSRQGAPAIFSLLREFYNHRRGYILFIFALLATLLVVGILLEYFIDLTEMLQNDQLARFDQRVTDWVFTYRTETMNRFFLVITAFGNAQSYFIIVPVVAIILYAYGHRWHLSIMATIILLSTSLLNILIKNIIARPRPLESLRLIEAFNFSYPSGHSMGATAFYGFLVYLVIQFTRRLWLKIVLVVLLVFLILAIGLSRIYLGVHFPSDVLAGFIAGIIWLAIFIMAFSIFRFFRRRSENESAG